MVYKEKTGRTDFVGYWVSKTLPFFIERLNTYVYACMHTYIHTYTHTHIHAYIHHACMSYIHTQARYIRNLQDDYYTAQTLCRGPVVNSPAKYIGGPRFWPGDRLSSVRVFAVFLSPCRQMPV
jgi:hypothetical protein